MVGHTAPLHGVSKQEFKSGLFAGSDSFTWSVSYFICGKIGHPLDQLLLNEVRGKGLRFVNTGASFAER